MNLSQIIGAMVAVIVAGMPAMLALLRISQLHILVNSRISELLTVSTRLAGVEGKAEGQASTSDLLARIDLIAERQVQVIERLDRLACATPMCPFTTETKGTG